MPSHGVIRCLIASPRRLATAPTEKSHKPSLPKGQSRTTSIADECLTLKQTPMRELGPSRISQPMLAAFITGAVRAVVCEALARIHTDHWIGSVTTDGFLSTAAVETIDQSGPIARSFSEARMRISPEDPKLWELKHREDQVFVLKTRGAVSCSLHKTKPLLARAGSRLGEKFDAAGRRGCGILEACARQDIRDTH